eukprot:CAMPEP_0119383520 /NCGR_PEP_ID=MMETSP1334-20130426/80161_1 /TAXON_ID=127549 /ORGANISM="Calcidiscus leptoporus, Strain RCC1130" /LENGTH=106 /DNA_ID=CAMNT_0007404347 /DNA_START=266 /DNA_END=583 /DNA_ORIENTATION=+
MWPGCGVGDSTHFMRDLSIESFDRSSPEVALVSRNAGAAVTEGPPAPAARRAAIRSTLSRWLCSSTSVSVLLSSSSILDDVSPSRRSPSAAQADETSASSAAASRS